jgi:hypothetical protein
MFLRMGRTPFLLRGHNVGDGCLLRDWLRGRTRGYRLPDVVRRLTDILNPRKQ